MNVVFQLELKANSKPSAEVAERLIEAILRLLSKEELEGYHLFTYNINNPLIKRFKANSDTPGS